MNMLQLGFGAGERVPASSIAGRRRPSAKAGMVAGEPQESKNNDRSPTHQATPPMAFGQLDHEDVAGQ